MTTRVGGIGCLSIVLAFALAACLGSPGTAGAQGQPETRDRPAATLLLPNFLVDLGDPNGVTTLFSINNASATAILAHVTVWSDLGHPVLAFDVYLTGYDVQTINLRDVINGVFPQTASDGQDPLDTISPQGPFSQDINFASCSGILPIEPPEPIVVAHVQASLTGQPSPLLGGRCAGQDFGDNLARGYVTVDTVNSCSVIFPSDPGYFAGITTFQNVLWGEYIMINPSVNRARGDALVHITARQPGAMDQFVPGDYTFYGRLVAGAATDQRHPLSTTWFARYRLAGNFDNGTVIVVWRDPKVPVGTSTTTRSCFSAGPPWYPLAINQIYAFDLAENPSDLQGVLCQVAPCPPPPPASMAFPAATQRVAIGGPTLPVPSEFGFLYLDLNTTVFGQVGFADPAAAQAFVEVSTSGGGVFNGGHRGIPLDNANERNMQLLSPAPLFFGLP